jgi:type VI protein secretion system component VasF
MNGTFTSQHWHGSSVYQGESALDQERAASMADEGGAAGAVADAREQAHVARSGQGGRISLWAMAGFGLGALVLALFWMRKR